MCVSKGAAPAWQPRVLNANINPGFIPMPPNNMFKSTSSAASYQWSREAVDKERVNKDHHLRKDPSKTYVEKALSLHDGVPPPLSLSPSLFSTPLSARHARILAGFIWWWRWL